MKGKRYTTEDKIRILREADKGKAIDGRQIDEVSAALRILLSARHLRCDTKPEVL